LRLPAPARGDPALEIVWPDEARRPAPHRGL